MSEKPLRNCVVSIYAGLLPRLREKAYQLGWALGVHGSLVTDLDLIAVPWIDAASDARTMVEALASVCEDTSVPAVIDATTWMAVRDPSPKPHGRMAWTISFGGRTYIDLSVVDQRELGRPSLGLPPGAL